MRLTASVAAVLFIGLAARISLTAQAGPTLDPVHSFDIASIRQVDRAPMRWLPKAAPAGGRAAGPLGDELPPSSTVLEDQLGLTLEKSRGAVDVLVVDRIEMPTDN